MQEGKTHLNMLLFHPGEGMGHSALPCQDRVELILLAFVSDNTAPVTARSTQRMYCLANLLLHSFSKKNNSGDLNSSIPEDLHRVKFNKMLGT